MLTGDNDAPPPITLRARNPRREEPAPVPIAGRRRMKEVEEVAREAQGVQPPSLYVLVTSPLEVWAIPGLSGSRVQTIFYKVPQVKQCDFVFEFPQTCSDLEEVLSTMKAEPKMVR